MINKIELATTQAEVVVQALRLLRTTVQEHTLEENVPQKCEYLIRMFVDVFQLERRY